MKNAFELGQIVITSNAENILNGTSVLMALSRHTNCDWGDVCTEDKQFNDYAVDNNDGRLVSSYHDLNGRKFLIITEEDRSVTTILLPEDY